MLNEIITVYAITDDLLKAMGHHEDCRREMSDAEIITGRINSGNVLQWESQLGLYLYERP